MFQGKFNKGSQSNHRRSRYDYARTTDLAVLLGSVRPDKIELEKGLIRWAQSSYWLDDLYAAVFEGQLPGT
jgi:hypothetical protein